MFFSIGKIPFVAWTAIVASVAVAIPAHSGDLTAEPLACGNGLFDWVANGSDDNHPSNNVSGVDCEKSATDGWNCVAVADEQLSIAKFSLERADGSHWTCKLEGEFQSPTDFDCLGGNDQSERDFEGVSLNDGVLVASGSWGMSRKKAELRARNWTLYRKKLAEPGCEARGKAELKSFVDSAPSPELKSAADRTLQCGGLNIEGFENIAGTYYFGLRSPSKRDAGTGYIIEARETALFGTSNAPKVSTVTFAREDGEAIKGIGIRALDAVGSSLVIVTGDAGVDAGNAALDVSNKPANGCPDLMQSDPPYPNRVTNLAPMIWIWTPGDNAAKLVGALTGDYARAKVEGITIVAKPDNKFDAILAIDSPKEPEAQLAIVRDLAIP
jgi:hypothetical protein